MKEMGMMDIGYDAKVLEEVKAIKKEVAGKSGLDDFGDPFFEAPLTAWVGDMYGEHVSDFGRLLLRDIISRDVYRRLKVIDCLKKNPEILDVRIPPIIIIMGAPRTGTTLLLNLMATHPKARSLLRWELTLPVPPPETKTYTTDTRIAKIQAAFEPLRGSLYEKMHWVNADEPDENTFGFYNCTGLLGRGIYSLMINWCRCIKNLDHRPVFREFRKLVQLLLWKCPAPEGGHLLLKCPMTTATIHQFAEVFPEAGFVLTHRDPFRALISGLTLSVGINQAFVKEQPGPLKPGGPVVFELFDGWKEFFEAMIDFRKKYPEKVTNVQYADLMENAFLSTKSVYNSLNMDGGADLEKRILSFLEKQRSGKRSNPPQEYDTFGLNHEIIWDDQVVSNYCKQFEIMPEKSHITDTNTGKKIINMTCPPKYGPRLELGDRLE